MIDESFGDGALMDSEAAPFRDAGQRGSVRGRGMGLCNVGVLERAVSGPSKPSGLSHNNASS